MSLLCHVIYKASPVSQYKLYFFDGEVVQPWLDVVGPWSEAVALGDLGGPVEWQAAANVGPPQL